MMWLLAAGIVIKVLSHTAPFPFLLERFAPGDSLWHMPRGNPPTVYLTFDDGPNPAATPDLLDVLRSEDVRATFFLIDEHLTQETAPIVRRMFAEGHAVAIHSRTRRLLLKTPDEFRDFLTEAARHIEALAGSRPCALFRPHAGWRGGPMYAGARLAGYRIVGWSWGMWDWNWYRSREGAPLAARLAKQAEAGDIIVMHDGHHENPRADRRYTVEAVARLVPALKQRGFAFGTLCGQQEPSRERGQTPLRFLPAATPSSVTARACAYARSRSSCELNVWRGSSRAEMEKGTSWPPNGSGTIVRRPRSRRIS